MDESIIQTSGLKLTKAAEEELHRVIQDRLPSPVGIRIAVEAGTGGVGYGMSFADEISPGEVCFDLSGLCFITSKNNMIFLENVQMDFMTFGETSGFVFNNVCHSGSKSCLQCTGACYRG